MPGDWGAHRDEQLPKLRWFVEGHEYALKETKERHVWKVYKTQAPDEEHGYVLVYVDDTLILGQDAQVTAVAEAIKTLWECSPMERLELNKTMRFCGFELTRERDGMFLGQTGYIKDLLQRRGVQGEETAPLPKVNEEEEEEEPNAGELKKAQMLIGEMMWLNRTRPDLRYATGLLSRMACRRPRYVNQLGNHLLKYLNKTADHGLHYRPCGHGDLAEDEQLPMSENRLIVYSDVSFAPPAESYRSIQGIACEWAGMLVIWDSTGQPYVAQSTGEAELISYSSAHQAGEATAVLFENAGYDLEKLLYGDSKAGLAAATNETGPWRTRRLRIRAHGLRDALRRSKAYEGNFIAGGRLHETSTRWRLHPVQGQDQCG